MKFSIVMPTFNDADTIIESLESIVAQTYPLWELFIVDDGSTDNTKNVVKDFILQNKDCDIHYVYQKNQDQLNAISNVVDQLKGDYIYLLHSDDDFASPDVLERANTFLSKSRCEAAWSKGLVCIDGNGNVIGTQLVRKYCMKEKTMALQLLWLGRNLFLDFAFFRIDIFKEYVRYNYLTWNTPFWLSFEPLKMLKIEELDFFVIKYRVFEGNYINNEIGCLNVINGELRTLTNLMNYFDIPSYQFQYLLFRIFNKLRLLLVKKCLIFIKKKNCIPCLTILPFIF